MSTEKNILLFNKWDSSEIDIKDPGLKRYIYFKECVIPHSCGRHAHKRFHKSNIHIVERFANKLMAPGRNAGKKILILNAIKRSFEILEIKTKKSPLQILVDAISNTAPREETTRISYGGIVFHSAVDSSPQRRVDISLKLIALSVQKASFNSIKSLEEIIAEQVLLAASNDPKSNAIKRKQDIERVALSAR
ncbi:MAG: 30S ribosomal protein S7 [Candidatus Hodarchaeales archaeon]